MLDIRFLVDRFFFLQPSEYVITSSSDLHCFWWEINCLSYCGCLVRGGCVSLLLQNSVCFWLPVFCTMMCCDAEIICCLSYLSFVKLLGSVWEYFSSNLGSFRSIFFFNMFFCSILFLFSFWYYNLMHMLVWLIVFYISLRQSSVFFFIILVFVSFLNCIISTFFSVFKTSDFFLM